jgi:hypothetical protein
MRRDPVCQVRTHASVEFAQVGRIDVELAGYFRRTRVPRIFWLLKVLRKFGTRRSISSK